MKVESRPSRIICFLSLFFLLMITQNQIAAGQSVAKARSDFDKLEDAYHTDKLSAEQYLDSAYALAHQYIYDGVHRIELLITGSICFTMIFLGW